MAPLAVFAAALLYFLLFVGYGFQPEDEGALLFWLERVARGQFPYVDFHTGYTPGYFYFGAGLLELVGHHANRLRVVVDVANAATAASLYVLARPLAGSALALVAPALWVAFLPVYPGEFASFNVPYRNHFRITLLPEPATMCEVFIRLERALARVARRNGTDAQRHVA